VIARHHISKQSPRFAKVLRCSDYLGCPTRCQTCEYLEREEECISCAKHFHNQPLCDECINGYFLSNNSCLHCDFQCETCTNSSSDCLVCIEGRTNAPSCECAQGFFEADKECKRTSFPINQRVLRIALLVEILTSAMSVNRRIYFLKTIAKKFVLIVTSRTCLLYNLLNVYLAYQIAYNV
jgi:hypothetical protein